MGKTKIDWPGLDRTWNPITGCPGDPETGKPCSYCVVRKRVWHRIKHLYGNVSYDLITEHPKRFYEPMIIKKPQTFFCGFYSDIGYWNYKQIQTILNIVQKCEQHKFMFLSKNPLAYRGFMWPWNCRCGFTLTKCEKSEDALKYYSFIAQTKARRFLSIEPLLGCFNLKLNDTNIEQCIVGAQTGAGAVAPKKEWIESVKENVPVNKLYWKQNIIKYI